MKIVIKGRPCSKKVIVYRCKSCGRIVGRKEHLCEDKHTIRKNGRSYYKRECVICHKDYETRTKLGIVCSKRCYGKYISINQSNYNHPLWKGGKGSHSSGYNTIRIDQGVYVLEHRYVMEKFLGRPLKDIEDVHHINGNKKDNRIENLKIMTRSEHSSFHMKQAYKNKEGSIWELNNK